MFIMVLYNLVDTWFIGLMHDDLQLAAVNLGYPVMMIMVALSNMIGTGASSCIARFMGAERKDWAEETLTAGFVMTFLTSIAVAVIGLSFLSAIVKVLGADETTAAFTAQYAGVLLAGSFFTMGSYTFGQLLRAEGSMKYSVMGMILGTIVNIILDPIFIFTFGMEIRGAAIATVLGNASGTLLAMFFYWKKKTLLQPHKKYLKPRLSILKDIYSVGVPASLETLLTSSAYIVNNNLASAYGAETVAAMGVSQKLMTFGSYIYQGFAAGLQPLMGYNYGAKNYRRMIDLMKACILVTTGIELCVMCIFGIGAPAFISLFSETESVIRIGTKVLRANMLILPFVGSISSSRAAFQSMGMPRYAFGITLVRQGFLYIPLLLILNKFFGFTGLIHAQPLTEAIMMAVSVSLLMHVLHRFENERINKTGG